MPRRLSVPSSRFVPLLHAGVWTAVFALTVTWFNTAAAQTFSIDLNEVSRIYDQLYPERTSTAVWDTTAAFDWTHVHIGNQHFKVPNFLETDYDSTETLVEYGIDEPYRFTFTVPRTQPFALRPETKGDLLTYQPRDFTIPGLGIEITPMDSVIADIRHQSLREVWNETTLESISAQRRVQESSRGGVRINIPLPMPKQLESIFGPAEKTHINITGREEITFAGETRKIDPFIGYEGRQKQSLFPSLEMKQNLDVRLDGTIGDKVNIQVDHSSDALSDQNNQIRLNYTGYEDDVIQLIELGSTSLSLPGSQLVSFSTQSKGLFGVKVLAQLGGTEMTFIASKQQGESSSASFSPTGGSIGQSESRRIADIDYVHDTYFFFSDPYYVGRDSTLYPTLGGGGVLPPDIYREVHPNEKTEHPNFFSGLAFVDNTGDGSRIQQGVDALNAGLPANVDTVGAYFELLDKDKGDYTYVLDAENPNLVIGIELSSPIPNDDQRALAVVYTNQAGHKFGGQRVKVEDKTLEEGGRLAMKLIKPRDLRDAQFYALWNYMMRNIYNLGLSNIDANSFDLEIEDNLVPRLNPTTPDSVSIPYIQIFGLDTQDQAGNAGHDGRVDARDGAILDLQRGILVFPDLTPFAPPDTLVHDWTDNEFDFHETRDSSFAAQYDTSSVIYQRYISPQEVENYHQYDIVVNAVSTTKSFQINALNIIEGSERITIDGRTLTKGVDYDIDYQTGQVDLKGPALENLTPASKIQIDYEYKPFGGGGSSSLAGISTVTKLGENARFGTTFLYESKNVAADKPRVGEEPSRSMVGDVNGTYSRQVGFLTDLANKLPLVDTDAPSTISLGGEVAVSIPDPNTKGKAYVDDFEGVEDSDRITMSRRAWYQSSPPVVNTPTGTEKFEASNKWGFVWYNIEPELGVRKRDLNPELDEKENSLVQSLDIELRTKPDSLVAGVDTMQWAGVMTGFGGGGLDLTQGQFIEVWVNDFRPNPGDRHGLIRIDLGQIDENFFHPDSNKWDDEDKNKDGWVAINEDTGLDGVYDAQEGATPSNPDPHGDDLDLSRINGRFVKVNGTEKNQVHDTEDLDGNGQLDRTNAYYSFTINLADSAVVDIRERFPGYDGFNRRGHENDAWRLYRIKLSDGVIVSPTGQRPAIDQIRHARIWFNDLAGTLRQDGSVESGATRIQIAELKVVGNRWQDDGVRNLHDEKLDNPTTQFAIGVISTKSDPGVYNPPIRPNVQNQVADKETSLFLRYDNLTDSTQVRVFKRFLGNGLDFSQYRQLNLWVHTDRLDPDLQYYFRLGTNGKNYYEIAVPLRSAYVNATGWARVLIDMEQLTNLKIERGAAPDTVSGTAIDAIDGNTYPIKLVGGPSLLGVRYLYAGIRSVGTTGQLHSGELWIDDIWLGEVRRDIDTAQRLNGSINIAGGVLNVNAGWTRTGPDFRSLRQRRGSGSESQSFNINGKTNLMSFIPLFGFSIPVSGQYAKTTLKPKFVPNSDIEITDPALADSLSTVSVTQGFSTSPGKKNSKNVLLRYTVDKMTTNFSYNRTQRRAPSSADTTTSMLGTLGYQINWGPNKDIRLPIPIPRFRNIKMRWWLNSLNVRTSASRRTTRSWRYVGGEYRPDPYRFAAGLTNTGTANYSPFRSLSSSFSATIERDVALPHQWLGFDVGREVRRNHGLKVTYRPPNILFIGAFSPDINVTTGYTEDASPTVRRPGDPRHVRNVSASRNASLKMRFDIGNYMGKLFRKMGWDVGGDKKPGQPGGAARGGGAGAAKGAGGGTAAPADSTKKSRADPMMAVRKLGEILTNIRAVNATVSQRTGSNYSRIPERPDLKYQFGIGTDSGIRKYGQVYDQPERVNDQLTIALDSGVEITDNIDVAGRYNRTRSNSDFRENHTRAVSTTFPDMQLSWKGLEKFGLFRPFMSFAQANMNYKQFHQESGQRGQTADRIDETRTIAPGMLLTWKNDMNSNVGVSYTKTSNATRGQKSENTTLAVNLDFKKSFRGGRGFKLPIPFFRRQVKWRSNLDSVVSIAYSRTGGRRYTEGTDFYTEIPGTNTIRVSPSLSYNFSQNLNGRAFVDYSRSFNKASGVTTTTVRVGVTAVFTF